LSNPLKQLYNWTISLAEKPGGLCALFLIAFAESSFFPIPPDILLIPLVLGARKKFLKIALVCSLGSVFGGLAGYGIGHFLWGEAPNYSSLARWFFAQPYLPGESAFEAMKQRYDDNAFLIVFTAGFTIIPYKLITISAGAFKINFWMFLFASGLSRAARFFLVATLIQRYGEKMQAFIERWFNLLSLAFCLILALGFYLVKVFA
jgi:membrane protein YqaA with SNARE-associated domain